MTTYHDLPEQKKERVDRKHRAISRIVKRLCKTDTWGFNDKRPIPVSRNFIKSHMRSINKLFAQIDIIMRYKETVHFRTFHNDFILISLEEV